MFLSLAVPIALGSITRSLACLRAHTRVNRKIKTKYNNNNNNTHTAWRTTQLNRVIQNVPCSKLCDDDDDGKNVVHIFCCGIQLRTVDF